jgi:ParB/RepB/Spo0J family partition protein
MEALWSDRLEVGAPGRWPLVELEVSLVDPPVERVRLGYSEEKLGELMESIPRRGLLQPAGVRKVGERFAVIWGDHRVEALRRLGVRRERFFVVDASDDDSVILAAHENLRRHDMSPIEEAGLCQRLFDVLGGDTDRVAREIGSTRDWVEQRLLMLRWPADVLKLVHEGRLNMKQARELARIKVDGDREYYTEFALDGGATAATVSAWARDWELSGVAKDPRADHVPPGQVAPVPEEARLPCFFHGDREVMGRLVHVWLCPEALALLVEFRRLYHAEDRAGVAAGELASGVSA